MWTITDGGYEGSPYGYEAPSLYRIDAETFTVEKQFKFKLGDWPSEVQLNGTRDTLYWINNDIWRMPVEADRVPYLAVLFAYQFETRVNEPPPCFAVVIGVEHGGNKLYYREYTYYPQQRQPAHFSGYHVDNEF